MANVSKMPALIPNLHPDLSPLAEIAYNLYWAWTPQCRNLFAAVDRASWQRSEHNPIKMLRKLTRKRQERLMANAQFMGQVRQCRRNLRGYLRAKTWYQQKYDRKFNGKIAYFSMEYGLHESLPIYAGGLGVLAGDHLKSAGDLGLPLVGLGIFWKQGYTRQLLDKNGDQVDKFKTLNPEDAPLREITGRSGKPLRIKLPIGPDIVTVRGWRLEVGRIPLVLLDTDLPDNTPKDCRMTRRLYSGDRDTRIRQEILLGVGGWQFLQAMKLPISVCHLNEGHAAFVALKRIAEIISTAGDTFAQAKRYVAATNVFTTHTPVPAGNETFELKLFEKYMGQYAELMKIDSSTFIDLGRIEPGNKKEPFGMTPLACRMSDRRNGVSKLHGAVARDMWKGLWPGKKIKNVPIGSVTNGIHLRTWLHPRMADLLDEYLPQGWEEKQDQPRVWQAVEHIPDEELWRLHQELKAEMIEFAREKARRRLRRNKASAVQVARVGLMLDPEALTIGFARRFAPYKRAALVFENPTRFARILNHSTRPVQIIFAGKAHPADTDGKALVKKVARLADSPRFRNRVVFLEDYEMEIARYLVSGVDVWLNTPRKPQEASGTSGMKPTLHGGLNLSILDGWWPEGFDHRNGWAIGKGQDHDGTRAHDKRDAAELYHILEREVVPLYYQRARDGLPKRWIACMKHSIATIPAVFNSHRQVKEYWSKYYLPAMRKA
ncbi:MAG: alpha-glucan family phosphorylase [Phycisphaerae bacterium]|nr:alpha-glucan family phosphorylase [Phycisphaerae bacterium]